MRFKLVTDHTTLQKALRPPKSSKAAGGLPGRPRAEDGQARDAGGHVVDGEGHRVYPGAGTKGGTIYRDKRGHWQYGTLAPPKGSRFDIEVPQRMSAEEKVAAQKRGEPVLDVASIHTNMQTLLAFAETHRFGANMAKTFAKKLPAEDRAQVLGASDTRASDLVGGELLTALIARRMGRTVYDLGDLNYIATSAYRLNLPIEQVWHESMMETLRDPDTGELPPDAESQVGSLWKEFTDAYNDVVKDPAVQQAARAVIRRKKNADVAISARVRELAPHLEKFAANILDGNVDPDVLALQITSLADYLGMSFTPHSLADIPQTVDPQTGYLYPADKQLQAVGTLHIDPGELGAVTMWLDSVSGTPQGSLGLAMLLPILQRYKDDYDNQRLATEDAPNHYEKIISSFTKPDGSPKDDFVSLPTRSTLPEHGLSQIELVQRDPKAFYRDASKYWAKDPQTGIVVQDNGLSDLLTHYLQKKNPEHYADDNEIKHVIQRINATGASWQKRVEAYNEGRVSDVGWALTTAATTQQTSLQSVFHDPQAVEKVLTSAREYAARCERALAAQTADPDTLKLPDWLQTHLDNTIDEKTGRPLAMTPYQKQAVLWMLAAHSGILAYDAGLGKTIIATIASAMLKHHDAENSPRTILFLPKVVLNQFPSEIRKWLGPKARIKVIGSDEDGPLAMTQSERLAVLTDIANGHLAADFVVCSASTLRLTDESRQRLIDDGVMVQEPGKDAVRNEDLSHLEYRNRVRLAVADDPIVQILRGMKGTMIFDESHHATLGLKDPLNHGHMIAKEILKDRKYKFGMTATPAPNAVDDLFYQGQLFAPGAVSAGLKSFHKVAQVMETREKFDANGNPMFDADGAPVFEQVPVFHQEFIAHNEQLKHAVFVKSINDESVRAQLDSAGLRLPNLRVSREVLPSNTQLDALLTKIMEGMDHPRRMRDAEIVNNERIGKFRDALATMINPEYAKYDPKRLIGLLEEGKEIKTPEGKVVNIADYGIRPPRLEQPQRWEDVAEHEGLAARYKLMMMQEALLHPQLVDPDYTGPSPKVDRAVENVLNHFQNPENARKPIVLAAEHVSVFPFIIDRLVQAGVNRSLIAEIKGSGDSGVGDPRAANDRDALAQAVNKGHVKVLLLGSRAGGAGLNLNGSRDGAGPSTMHILEEPWTPTDLTQLMHRVYRAGQMSDVEVRHINVNMPQDFHRMHQNIKKVHDLYLLLEKQSEKVGAQARAGKMAELLLAELKKMGSVTPDTTLAEFAAAQDAEGNIADRSVRYGVLDPESMKENIKRLGLSDHTKIKDVPDALKQKYYFKPFQRFVSFERFVKNGFDKIENKRQALRSQFRNKLGGVSAEVLRRESAQLDKHLDHWYAASAACGKLPLLVARNTDMNTKHGAGGIKFLRAENPFKRYVVEDEHRKMIETDKKQHPEAVTGHSDRPGVGGKYTDFYLWDAARKYDVRSAEDMVDRVLRPLSEQVGHWSDDVRSDLIARIGARFDKWERDGHIAPYGQSTPVKKIDRKKPPAEDAVSPGDYGSGDDTSEDAPVEEGTPTNPPEEDQTEDTPAPDATSPAAPEEGEEEEGTPAPEEGDVEEPTPQPSARRLARQEPAKKAPTKSAGASSGGFPLKMTPEGATGTPKFQPVKFDHGGRKMVLDAQTVASHWGRVRAHIASQKGVPDADALLKIVSDGKLVGKQYHGVALALVKELQRAGAVEGGSAPKGTKAMEPRVAKPKVAPKSGPLKLTVKGASVSTVPDVQIDTDDQEGTIPSKAATSIWKRIKEHMGKGNTVNDQNHFLKILKDAGMNVGEHHAPVAAALISEFKKLGLLEG